MTAVSSSGTKYWRQCARYAGLMDMEWPVPSDVHLQSDYLPWSASSALTPGNEHHSCL